MANPVQQYIAALNANPNDADALSGLDHALSEERAWADIEHMLPRFARRASDDALRACYLGRAAFVARHMNGNATLADQLLGEILALSLDGGTLVASLRRGFEPHADWRGFVGVLLDLSELPSDDRIKSRLYHALGRAYEDKLYERERAITCYQRAFKLDPMFTEPLRAARSVYAHADQWNTVAKLYQIELRVTEDRREQARLLKELGHIELERLGERDKGIESLRKAAELDPDLSGVVAAIADIESDAEAHGVIVSPRILQSSAAATVVPDVVPRHVPEPAVVDMEVEPVSAAYEVVEDEAPAAEPVPPVTVPDTVELTRSDVESVDVETIVLDDETQALAGDVDAPAERAESGDVEFAGDDGGVERVEASGEALAERVLDDAGIAGAGDEGHAEDELAAPGARDDAPSGEGLAPPAEASDTLDELAPGDTFETPGGPPALEATDPDAEPAPGGEAIDVMPTERAPSDDAGATPDPVLAAPPRESEVVPGPSGARVVDPLELSADVHAVSGAEAMPGRSDFSSGAPRAVGSARREPRPTPAVAPLDGDVLGAALAAARAGGLAEWAWVLEVGVRAAATSDDVSQWFVEALPTSRDRDDATRRLLAPLFGHTALLEAALDRLMEADEREPGAYAGAAYAVAFYGLGSWSDAQVFARASGAAAAADAEAVDAAQKGNWRKAQLVLSERFNGQPGVDAEAEGYRAQAFVALGLGKEDKAIDSFRRVLRSNKHDEMALEWAAVLYRRDQKWAPLADTLRALVGAGTPAPGRVAAIWRDLVGLYRGELNQPTNVIVAYKALLEVDARDVATIDEYAALLEELNRPQDLVHVLRMKADAIDDVQAKIAIHGEVARLFVERFSNQPEAIASYEQVLALDPASEPALLALEDLYGKRREWEKLIAVKRQLVELSSDDRERVARMRDTADVAATRMRDQALAAQLWTEVLELDPNDALALENLERLYEREKDWARLASVLERRVHVLSAADERGLALLKLAQIQNDRLGRVADAVGTYEELLTIDPENFRAKDAVKKAYVELSQWDRLEEFYERSGAWAEYVRQLESLVGTVAGTSTQVDLLFRAADTWSDRLGDGARATKALERVLTLDERNYDAALRLVPVYEERQDFKRLPGLLEVVLGREEDSERRFALMVQLARLASEKQRDAQRAFQWFCGALGVQPHRVEILGELESSCRAAGQWRALEGVLADARDALAGEADQLSPWRDLSLSLGRVYHAELGDPESALACFDQVLAHEPSNVIALDAKDAIYTAMERWTELLAVLDAKIVDAATDDARVTLLGRAARVHEAEVGDIDAAIRAHEDVLEIEPASLDAHEALRRLHGQSGDARALTEVLRRLIAIRGDRGELDERRVLRLQLADVYGRQLGEPAAAVECLQLVVAEAPRDPAARQMLEALLDDEGERAAVARTLEPLYESEQAWSKLVDVLELQLAACDGGEAAVALLSKIGDLQRDRLANGGEAIDAYSRLLRLRPSDRSARDRIEAVAETSRRWEPVVELYEALMGALDVSDPDDCALAVELGERAAGFYDTKLGDPAEAIRVQRRVLDVAPGRQASLLALDVLYTRTEQWPELLGVIDERLAHTTDVAARRALHVQAAAVWEHRLEDLPAAIGAYRQVLQLVPEDQDALEALDHLYGLTGDPSGRAEALRARIALAEAGSGAQIVLKNRLARLAQDELGDVPGALSLWREVLAVDPRNDGALEGLEGQLEGEDFALAAADVLEPIYVRHADHSKLSHLLEIRLRASASPADRLVLFQRLAGLHEAELRDAPAAYHVMLRAAEEYLGEREVIDELTRLAGALGRFADLADALEGLANDAADPSVRRDTLALVARLREERIGDAAAAAALWRQVLDDGPEDREALDALERLDQHLQQWSELVDVLLRKAELPELASAPSRAKPLMLRAAAIYEEMLEKPSEAIEVLQRVLLIDAADRHTIGELERLFTQTARWEDLVENYQRKLALAGSDDERRDLYFTLGAVLETELADPDRAVETYKSALALFPNDLEALQALDRLYLQTESWYELLSVLRRQAELVEAEDQQRNVQYRVARLLETELGDAPGAIETYRAILAVDPSHRASRSALQVMISKGEDAVAAASLLEPIYRAEGAWHELISIIRTLIDAADSESRRRDHYVDIARIMESELADANGAIEAYSAAAQEAPRVAELVELERLAPIPNAWPAIARLFAELWDAATDPPLQAEIGTRLARIRERELEDISGAIQAYVRLHEEAPSSQMPLRELDRLYAQTGQWPQLAEVLQKRIYLGGPENDPIELRLRLGNLSFEFLDDAAEAVSTYRQVLQDDRTNAKATTRLEAMIEAGVEAQDIAGILDPLYRETGAWRKLVGLNQMRVHTEVSADERYRVWLDTAEVQERQLADKGEALNALGNALFERPGDDALKDRIEELGGAIGQWSVVADIYALLLEQELGDTERLETSLRLARVLSGPLADAARAEVAYRLVLDVDQAHVESLVALDRMFDEQGRWSELAAILGRRREASYDPAEQTALAFRQAELYRDRLADPAKAIATFNEVLDVHSGHRASIDALVVLYEGAGRWSELFDTYERLSIQLTDDRARTDVTVKMAQLATERLDRPNDGIDLWQAVLAARPTDRQALANLARLYELTEQYNDLADVIDRQVAQESDPSTREALLRRAGALWADVLDNQDQAIARWSQVLQLRAGDPGALAALRGLYEAVGHHERLADVLEQLLLIGSIPTEEEADVYEQLGTLYADTLARPADAIEAWTEVSARRTADEAALDRLETLFSQEGRWSDVVATIERKVALGRTDDDRIELLKRIAHVSRSRLDNLEATAAAYERVLELDLGDFDATSNLEDLYTKGEAWGPLAALCVDRLEVVSDPWERVQLLRRAATLYESRLGQQDAAFLILAKATQESPSDEELRRELERLAAVTGKHAELVRTYDEIARRMVDAGDVDGAVPFLIASGDLADRQLGQLGVAENYYERVLGLDAENEGALRALESVYERGQAWGSLVGVLRRRVALTMDVREQVACHKRIGGLFEVQLGDVGEAVESYKMATRLDDTDAEALAALERIYRQSSMWRELVEVLRQKADATYDPPALVQLHTQMGQLWQLRLNNPERAVAAFNEVLNHEPANRGALEALEALYAGLDKWDRFLAVLDTSLSVATSREERIQIFAKQALVHEQHFDDVDSAVSAHLNILALDPQDLEAINALERIFTDQERFAELLETLERHVHAVETAGEKADVLCRMAQVYVEQQDDPYQALNAYRRVLELVPGHTDALARSGALFENIEQFADAVAAYERLAEVIPDPATRLRLYFRAGQLLQDQVVDASAARLRFEKCLELDSDFEPAMEALERIHSATGDWTRALSMIQAQIDVARDLPRRSALMVRMARIHADELGERPRAQQLYEEAIELEPTNLTAASPLARVYFQQQEWVRARPLLQLLLRAGDTPDGGDQGELQLMAGSVNEQLGFDAEAITHLEHVLDHDRGNLHALRGLARLYSRLGRSDAAYQTYMELLAEHRRAMPDTEVVEAFVAAGEIKLQAGDDRDARHLFSSALDVAPAHPTALRHLLALVEKSGSIADVVEVKQRMLAATADDLQRFKLFVDIGDGLQELGDITAAENAYREAVRLDPKSRVVLHKLLNIFTDTGNWRRATEVLGQLASMEEHPERLAKLCFTIAAIFRDELGEVNDAVRFFNQALDAKYDYLEAFEAIDHLLTSARDWRALEQNYRRMIERVETEGGADSTDLKITLFKNLGEIYRSRLQEPDKAIAAYDAACRLSPDDPALLEILAKLLERSGGSSGDIIRQHHRLVAASWSKYESHRALFKAYLAERRFDEAWCLASSLVLLGKASPEETQYYERYLPPNVLQARAEITLEQWTKVIFHPGLDQHLTNLFALLSMHLRAEFRRDPKEWGLKRKDRLDLEQQMPLTKMVSYAASRVGVPDVAVYEKHEQYGLINMNCDPPSLLAGHDMMSGKAQRDLAFQVAKAVTLLKPEFYLASAYPSSEHLKTFFLAAYAASTGQVVGEGNAQLVTAYAQAIQELPPPVPMHVRRAIEGILGSGRSPDLSAWLRAVDHTASRVGLLLSGDLRTAVKMVQAETEREQSISKADLKEKVPELILFSVSEPYFALRRDLGLALQPK